MGLSFCHRMELSPSNAIQAHNIKLFYLNSVGFVKLQFKPWAYSMDQLCIYKADYMLQVPFY